MYQAKVLARAVLLALAVMVVPVAQEVAAQPPGNVLEVRDENNQLLLRGIVIADPTGEMGELLVHTHDGQMVTLNAPAPVIRLGSRVFRTTRKELQDNHANNVLNYFRAQVAAVIAGQPLMDL